MDIFLTAVSVTLAQIPGILFRYIPFSKLITQKQKRNLLLGYSLCFILQNILLLTLTDSTEINPLFYKIVIMFGAATYLFINCIIIKRMLFQHFFIFGMLGCYSLTIHSLSAIILSRYAESIVPQKQLIIQSLTYLLLFAIITYALWNFIKNSFILNISTGHDYYWNIIWVLPVLLYFSNIIVTMDNHWISTWNQFIARLLTGCAIFVAWKCVNLDFKELEEKLALKSANKLLYIQMDAIIHQAETINENDKKMRILRHDMRHNIQMLSSLIVNGEIAAASTVISELNDNLESTKPIVFCKNPVINSSLLVYINMAQTENIEIISEVDIPLDIPWNSNDIAILFANVLENAIIASRKQIKGCREIQINTRYFDKKLAIVVKNRFDGKVLFDDDGMPVSTVDGHGVGMTSISTIVSKYHGNMVCSHEKSWFTISFMFSEYFISSN